MSSSDPLRRWVIALLRTPAVLYDWNLGWLLGRRFLRLTHRGRRSGRCYRMMLEVIGEDRDQHELFVMVGLGPRAQWYRNIVAGGAVEVEIGSERFKPDYREREPAGLRISEALAFQESDLDSSRGAVLVRRGKGPSDARSGWTAGRGMMGSVMKAYYDTRASEYDEWYLGLGKFAGLERPHWDEDVQKLTLMLAGLPAARTLDVACGTGYLTQHLRGEITLLDQSERMLAIARQRLPGATAIHGDALTLPFDDNSFERVFTAHFYGHLEQPDRDTFLAEARRVAPQLIVVDSALAGARPRGREPEEWQERVLNDGSRFTIYKRYFDGPELAAELGGGMVLHESRWFVLVSTTRT